MASADETFLSSKEVKQLRAMYSDWLSKLKPDEFVQRIYGEHLISEFEYENITTMQTSHKKSEYMFHNILIKATYRDITYIRKVLLKMRQPGMKSLAKKLPIREPSFDFDQFDSSGDENESPMSNKGQNRTPKKSAPCKQSSYTKGEQSQDCEMFDEEAERDLLDLEGEDCHQGPSSYISHASTTNYPASKPGGTAYDINKADRQKRQSENIARPSARADFSEYQPRLKCYNVKPGNDSRTGKGLCAIMRNFSAELRGYETDAESIKGFFGDVLGYDIIAEDHNLVDMSAKEFRHKLIMLQGLLVNKYDRFVLFILSHGDEKGIKMCSPSNRKNEEKDQRGEPVRITVDEIVEHFSHDKIKTLKSFPKCFFIQACQGEKVAAPAATADRSRMETEEEENNWEPPSHNITNKADILVCLPSQKGTYSWVPSTGSWFVQEMMAIFQKHYKSEHIVDMMVAVNDALSKREGKGKIGDGEVIDVYQMPGMACSLTQKFFLSIPPLAPYIDNKN